METSINLITVIKKMEFNIGICTNLPVVKRISNEHMETGCQIVNMGFIHVWVGPNVNDVLTHRDLF